MMGVARKIQPNQDCSRRNSMAAIPESPALIQVRSQIDALRGEYNIDPDRLYVVGVSMGGFGAWDMIARHPDIFAAGSPAGAAVHLMLHR